MTQLAVVSMALQYFWIPKSISHCKASQFTRHTFKIVHAGWNRIQIIWTIMFVYLESWIIEQQIVQDACQLDPNSEAVVSAQCLLA